MRQDVSQAFENSGSSPVLSFEILFRAQRLGMVRLAHLITGSNAVAEEVVQEAFIRLHEHWDRADNHAAYLRTIVTNLCKTQLRQRDRERRLAPPTERLIFPPDIDETWIAICRLPFRQRAALALRF